MTEIRPRRIEIFPNGEIGIVWSDGREDYLDARSVRLACPCAGCVDEMTGRRTLDAARVPADVTAVSWSPVGQYGVSFEWSDGHRSGIYRFALLRELASAPPERS
ncbi:MAG: DUF971 domain-containing protein [Acidobacteria bacterium]|nr:MAG: DUF971 domain-containing protein [Acidobacteriota bacterium]